jgi:hypothetical protein
MDRASHSKEACDTVITVKAHFTHANRRLFTTIQSGGKKGGRTKVFFPETLVGKGFGPIGGFITISQR